MNDADKNKQFAKLAGVPVADFGSDSRLVLREMMKREDWPDFAMAISCWFGPVSPIPIAVSIDLILDTTGKVLDLAIKWLKEGKYEYTY